MVTIEEEHRQCEQIIYHAVRWAKATRQESYASTKQSHSSGTVEQ